MAEEGASSTASGGPGTNPHAHQRDGAINPSAPAAGTEQWGNTSDERRALTENDPKHTRAGQTQGNPGDNQTEASLLASAAATSNKSPDSKPSDNQADPSRKSGASSHSMNISHGGADRTFRCADAGNSDCQWETSGRTEDEILQRAREHGRRDHGMADWTEAMNDKVRDAIRHRAA